jgi:hypothetical protein
MNDFLFLALTLLFFALTFEFLKICERLMGDKS